jgi:hypothetical protein
MRHGLFPGAACQRRSRCLARLFPPTDRWGLTIRKSGSPPGIASSAYNRKGTQRCRLHEGLRFDAILLPV